MFAVFYCVCLCCSSGWLAGLTLFLHAAAEEGTRPLSDAAVQFRSPCFPSDPSCLFFSSSSYINGADSFSGRSNQGNLLYDRELEVEEEAEEEEEEDEMEGKLNCVFSSVPLIGGSWLTKLARSRFADSTILQATHSFLMGGRLVSRVVDLGSSSAASRLLMTLERCLKIAEKQEPSKSSTSEGEFEAEEVNHHDRTETNEPEDAAVFPEWVESSPVWSRLQGRRRKRSVARTIGYGADPLVGFNFLGFLVVGALITFLVHMLV